VALSFSAFETAMGFVGKEGLQPSGSTYRVALLHMPPMRSLMSRFIFQTIIYLRNSSRPKPLKTRFVQKKPLSRDALKPD
jgi:hypothetical protein